MKLAFFKAILQFCTTKKLFKCFHTRYTKQQLAVLNSMVRTRDKIRTYQTSSAILKKIYWEEMHSNKHEPPIRAMAVPKSVIQKVCLLFLF